MKDLTIDKTILKEWKEAVANNFNGYYEAVADFKNRHQEEYKLITAMYRKRVVLRDCLAVMKDLNEPVYWFTLTFNNSKDSNKIESKRKEALAFLNNLCICYVVVEEFGEDNGRYHLHGFLCFKYSSDFNAFRSWHSRQKIELLPDNKISRKIRYLTKYAVKQVPRIRKSKTLCKLYNFYKVKKYLKNSFNSTYLESFNKFVASVVNPF